MMKMMKKTEKKTKRKNWKKIGTWSRGKKRLRKSVVIFLYELGLEPHPITLVGARLTVATAALTGADGSHDPQTVVGVISLFACLMG